ncbi:M20 family metallopeptidase [Sediminibacillus massiliensis]|uniref:M20 family metallopeptidase n=1 Tax=Sediminibacillus massiliensis TaxID=1926277 RepID=UPI003CCC3BE5
MITEIEAYRDKIKDNIDRQKEKYLDTSHVIHENPEIGNEEYFASEKLSNMLEDAGFQVKRNVAGHETGFVAEKTSSRPGPTIGYLAEYDALPGLGHACGHNIIGTTSVAAGIALAEVIDEVGGTVKVFGTPAEEGGPNGSAKGSFVREGLFDDTDVALMLHPENKTRLTKQTLAIDPLEFHFHGKASHASGAPEQGINALDAMIQFFSGIGLMRQQLTPDVKIHGVITDGGKVPNAIPDYTSASFLIRANSWEKVKETSERVRNIAEGAAMATGCSVDIERIQNEVREFNINPMLDEALGQEFDDLGEDVIWHPKDGVGSTDAGNVSQVIPTTHGYIKIGPGDIVSHTPEFREAAISETADKALITGAKTLALTGLKLISNDTLLGTVKEEFERSKQNQG